jgi:hypothetical protein
MNDINTLKTTTDTQQEKNQNRLQHKQKNKDGRSARTNCFLCNKGLRMNFLVLIWIGCLSDIFKLFSSSPHWMNFCGLMNSLKILIFS